MDRKRLAVAVSAYLKRYAAGFPSAEGLRGFFKRADEERLFRINAYEVADGIHVGRRRLLELFLDMVARGLLDLNWEFHCPYCNGITGRHRHLSDATTESACTVCKIRTPFSNELDGNVEVTFTPVARLYEFSRAFVDQVTRKMIAQIDAGTLTMPLVYVRGIDCVQLPLFREKFGTEVLSRNESLSIKRICIMFTDIRGSTALYEQLGDAKAYRLVRHHFDLLFRVVERAGGVVVKTIGDSVMASFGSSAQGVAAALRIQAVFGILAAREKVGERAIVVKIGLHVGPSLLVNLNERADYFGRTINLASRIQGTAAGGEIIISQAMRNDPACVRRMAGRVRSVTKRTYTFKGIDEPQVVFRLNLAPAALQPRVRRDGDHVRG